MLQLIPQICIKLPFSEPFPTSVTKLQLSKVPTARARPILFARAQLVPQKQTLKITLNYRSFVVVLLDIFRIFPSVRQNSWNFIPPNPLNFPQNQQLRGTSRRDGAECCFCFDSLSTPAAGKCVSPRKITPPSPSRGQFSISVCASGIMLS